MQLTNYDINNSAEGRDFLLNHQRLFRFDFVVARVGQALYLQRRARSEGA
jgi:hypothetical protein